VIVFGFLGMLHAQLEGETGEDLSFGVLAQPRPLFFGDPASGFYPCFALRTPLELVAIFHDPILAQAAMRLGPLWQATVPIVDNSSTQTS
jgi:hypothetical protein